MESVTRPRYGTVESYARILRPLKPENLDMSALAIVRALVDNPDDSGTTKVEYVKNLLAAVKQVRNEHGDD